MPEAGLYRTRFLGGTSPSTIAKPENESSPQKDFMDKIICVGKNYPDHAEELGDVQPKEPVLFLKPPSTLVAWQNAQEPLPLRLPRDRGAVHYEAEVVCRMKHSGRNFSESQALECVDSVTLGLDMTLRDLQQSLKKQGHPWTISKVFSDAAVVGPWVTTSAFQGDYLSTPFAFFLNEKLVQSAIPSQMLWSVARCIALASRYFDIIAGDIVFTGTPCGVGSVCVGDVGRLNWGPIDYSVVWR